LTSCRIKNHINNLWFSWL